MSKKKKKRHSAQEGSPQEAGGESVPIEKEAISSAGWKTIGAGVLLLILGFGTLSLTDPEGRNWASALSPFLILGAYAVIALGIFLPEPETPLAVPPSGTPPDPSKTSS